MPVDMLVKEAQGLSEKEIANVIHYVKFLKFESNGSFDVPPAQTGRERRKAGMWKGLIKIPDDFGEPQITAKQSETDEWYRKPGLLKGQIVMSDDFDEPLEDFAEYM